MLRSQSKCTQNVIGGYIGGKMIWSPQFTQDVPTGFQVTSPPVTRVGLLIPIEDVMIDLDHDVVIMEVIKQFQDLGNTLGALEVIQDLCDEEAAQVPGEGKLWVSEEIVLNTEEQVCSYSSHSVHW